MGNSSGQARALVVESVVCRRSVVSIAVRGFISLASVRDSLRLADVAMGATRPAAVVLLDVSDIDSFEPGVPAKVIQWLGTRAELVPAVVVVSARPVVRGVVRAAAVMLSNIECDCVATRSEGLARAERLAARRDAVTTGVHARLGM